MSKKRRDKLFAKIKGSPKSVTFNNLKKLLEMFDAEIEPPRRGSHYKIRLKNTPGLTLPRPHGKHMDERYVKKAISILEEIVENEE